ncbi:MAG: chemotaxis response regulator protein-glutamate methylesterase, partial [Silvanigrellaceae bacterium]|nr:chemotaxis response regulator protein-glutamate methylesterase [Silvanigrellaceae bacterium]
IRMSLFQNSPIEIIECNNNVVSLSLSDKIFIVCYNLIAKKSTFLTIKNECLNKNIINTIAQKITEDFNKTADNIQLKIVAHHSISELLYHTLKEKNFQIVSFIKQINTTFQVVYYSENNRLRVEKTNPLDSEPKKPLRILVVDDSPTIHKILNSIFKDHPQFEVVGNALLPSKVEELIQKTKPDVITLDIHMPEMNGVELLKILWPKYSLPTVMISSLNPEEGPYVLDALESGAVDYIQKPTLNKISEVKDVIFEKIMTAALTKKYRKSAPSLAPKLNSSLLLNSKLKTNTLIAIGSSTGGTEALREILIRLPENIPPIVIVQHIPPVFSKALATRLNELCSFSVKEAEQGDELTPNKVFIAPGGKHMKVTHLHTIELTDELPVHNCKPSVDILFHSVAENFKQKTIGIILTGMGSDGAKGLLHLKEKGAQTIAQDQNSCIVFGMPREAIELGAAKDILPLMSIPDRIIELLS